MPDPLESGPQGPQRGREKRLVSLEAKRRSGTFLRIYLLMTYSIVSQRRTPLAKA